MKKVFKDLQSYIKVFDGYGRPRLNFQNLYKLFPDFTFEPTKNFGQYANYGKAYENKDLSMRVTDKKGNEVYLIYKEYTDTIENLAYLSR